MESTRAYSFPMIVWGIVILAGGYGVGRAGMHVYQRLHVQRAQKPSDSAVSGSMIMHKRMYAIKDAVRQGKDSYEFDVVGIQPTFGNQ